MVGSSDVLDCLGKASLFVCGILVLLLLMRNSSAAARHTVIRFGFLGLVLLPVAKLLIPGWVFPLWVRTVDASQAKNIAAGLLSQNLGPAFAEAERSLAWVWLFGFAYVVARILSGLIVLAGKKRSLLTESNPRIDTLVKAILGDRKVKVMFDPENHPPMTWGYVNPIVMLPTASFSWNEKRLKSVVEHELAHVDRSDWLNLLLAKLVSALYWFHPLVWILERRLNTESEKAADDRAIQTGCKPVEYAYHLLETARSHAGYSSIPGLAMGRSMGRSSQLRTRLTGILAKDRLRKPLSSRVKGTVGVLTTGLACIIATATPKTLYTTRPDLAKTQTVAAPHLAIKSTPKETLVKPSSDLVKEVWAFNSKLAKPPHRSVERVPVSTIRVAKTHRHKARQADDLSKLYVLSQNLKEIGKDARGDAPSPADVTRANQVREEIIAQASETRKLQQQMGGLDSRKISEEIQELASKLASPDLKRVTAEKTPKGPAPEPKPAPEAAKAPSAPAPVYVIVRTANPVVHVRTTEVHLDFSKHHSKGEADIQINQPEP